MAGSLNKVQLIGNVGKDPEIRSLKNGDRVASFSVAMTEKWKDRDGDSQEKTEWANVVVFNDGLAGVIERYVQKGSKVYVEGKFTTRKWTDKDGIDRYSTEVVLSQFAGQIILLGGGQESSGERSGRRDDRRETRRDTGRGSRDSFSDDLDDDIPF
jgi:single-strand DNA-binding protein